MNINDVTQGDIITFIPEELIILVVMTGEDGIRYIEPMNPEFDDHGNVKTKFVSYATLSEWSVSLGSLKNIIVQL